jgi:hemolysin III
MTKAEKWIREHTRSELIADAVLHVLGLLFGVGALIALAAIALPDAHPTMLVGLAVYAFGMLSMFGSSALYNLTRRPARRALFRRFDHAAIFLMIAGSYTPFGLTLLAGPVGYGLLGFVWTMALAGAGLKLAWPDRFERASVVAYLLLGWSVLYAIRPLLDQLSAAGITLLFAGGALYSIGVIFHLWERLRYGTAIWHGFVLAASACHFAAVVVDVAIA